MLSIPGQAQLAHILTKPSVLNMWGSLKGKPEAGAEIFNTKDYTFSNLLLVISYVFILYNFLFCLLWIRSVIQELSSPVLCIFKSNKLDEIDSFVYSFWDLHNLPLHFFPTYPDVSRTNCRWSLHPNLNPKSSIHAKFGLILSTGGHFRSSFTYKTRLCYPILF